MATDFHERRQTRQQQRGALLLFCLSALLNLLLIIALAQGQTRKPRAAPQPLSGREQEEVSTRLNTAVPANHQRPQASGPPFLWADIESPDYPKYISNLRAIGCPEIVISDIIHADLNQQYVEKMAAVWRPPLREYWQKTRRDQPTNDERAKLDAFTEEKGVMLRELLGTSQNEQAWADVVLFQLQGEEQELLFLPEEKQAAALRALADSGLEKKEAIAREAGSGNRDELFQEKLKVLAHVLSSEELEEFRLRYSPAAESLRIELQYFDCTAEEFKKLLQSRENETTRRKYSELLDRQAATAEATELFGPERGKVFERVTDLFYISARRSAEDHGLPPETASQVWEVIQSARASAAQVVADPSFSSQTKLQRIRTLRTESEAEITRIMGETAARSTIRDVRVVLGTLENRIKP